MLYKKAQETKSEDQNKFTIWPTDVAPKQPHSKIPLTVSSTYGTNDPLSLFWMVSLANNISNNSGDSDLRAEFILKVKAFVQSISNSQLAKKSESKGSIKTKIVLHNNAFVYLSILRLYKELEESTDKTASTNTTDGNSLKEIIREKKKQIYEILEGKLHRHLSYSSIPDSRFDPAELTFCLEGMQESKYKKISAGIVKRVFDVLLNTQQHTSVFWKPTTPIYAKSTGHVLLPLSIEVANSLLRTCELLDSQPQTPEHFIQCIPLFQRYIQWLKAQQCTVSIEIKGEEFDLTGWASEHTATEECIHTWQTSQILLFLNNYNRLFNRYIAHTTLRKSRLKLEPAKDIQNQKTAIEEFKSSDPICDAWREKITTTIAKYYFEPRIEESEISPDCSFLLYGPPGTGKTRLADEISKILKWPYLIITPSDFLAGGAAEVEHRAKAIFSMLQEQEKLVVLFDEIDHLLLDRESEEYSKLTGIFQFITPGMLPKLNNLRESARIIFIIATNYAERIDSAIKRVGRIDRKLLLLPPDSKYRREIIKGKLALNEELNTELLNTAVNRTKLRTWKEINSACSDVPQNEIEKLKLFTEIITSRAPSITTGAYSGRFFSGGERPAGKQQIKPFKKVPWEEFVSLYCIEEELEERLDKTKFEEFLLDEQRYNDIADINTENSFEEFKKNLKKELDTCLKK